MRRLVVFGEKRHVVPEHLATRRFALISAALRARVRADAGGSGRDVDLAARNAPLQGQCRAAYIGSQSLLHSYECGDDVDGLCGGQPDTVHRTSPDRTSARCCTNRQNRQGAVLVPNLEHGRIICSGHSTESPQDRSESCYRCAGRRVPVDSPPSHCGSKRDPRHFVHGSALHFPATLCQGSATNINSEASLSEQAIKFHANFTRKVGACPLLS